MNDGLSAGLKGEIIAIARSCGIEKLILFGSRARGNFRERSDIDLAVVGGDGAAFYDAIEENTSTLLMYDVVILDQTVSEELKEEIEREGILLYEEV